VTKTKTSTETAKQKNLSDMGWDAINRAHTTQTKLTGHVSSSSLTATGEPSQGASQRLAKPASKPAPHPSIGFQGADLKLSISLATVSVDNLVLLHRNTNNAAALQKLDVASGDLLTLARGTVNSQGLTTTPYTKMHYVGVFYNGSLVNVLNKKMLDLANRAKKATDPKIIKQLKADLADYGFLQTYYKKELAAANAIPTH
jgi:hypothetical protein